MLMPQGISYSIRRAGPFRWRWRAYLPDGRVVHGCRLTGRGAKRAALASVRAWQTSAAAGAVPQEANGPARAPISDPQNRRLAPT